MYWATKSKVPSVLPASEIMYSREKSPRWFRTLRMVASIVVRAFKHVVMIEIFKVRSLFLLRRLGLVGIKPEADMSVLSLDEAKLS